MLHCQNMSIFTHMIINIKMTTRNQIQIMRRVQMRYGLRNIILKDK